MAQDAVLVRSLRQSYGKTEVLKDLSMTVKVNTIFGLLGPSGCGKTTLLKCLVGRVRPSAGLVRVFGHAPGQPGAGIPGPRVGYMPQELALFHEFTLGETLFYFGRIFRLAAARIRAKQRFLTSFLDLPADQRVIGTFSGGQQRRASLAAALLHEPELLILDEPTVGVDPLLRQAIWDYLTDIAAEGTTTIIITTHYVEEARQANAVGLMRAGRLLAESEPGRLIETFNQTTLEAVFLHLCMRDRTAEDEALIHSHTRTQADAEDGDIAPDRITGAVQTDDGDVPMLNGGAGIAPYADKDDVPLLGDDERKNCTPKTLCRCQKPSFWAFYALMVKNLIKMRRNVPFLLFQFLLPAIQIVLFSVCIGHDPQNLHFGVLNEDQGLLGVNFGDEIVRNLDKKVFTLTNYTNFSVAYDDVKAQTIWGFVEMKPQFSKDLALRFLNQSALNNQTLDGGSLHLYLDMSNQQIALIMQTKMMTAFTSAADHIVQTLGIPAGAISVPIKVEKPIYGSRNPTFTDFMAPGIITSILSFMATGLTALSFVLERKEGLLDRTYVAGVGAAEVFMAHIVTQFLVMMVQDAILLIFTLVAFQVPCRGPLILLIILTLLLGFFGMALGFLISASCKEENTAIQMALGTVYPNMLLNGVIWPIEGMPLWLASVAKYLPLTLPIEAMRSIMLRGLGLDHQSVWLGYIVVITWSAILVLLTFIVLRIKGT